MRRMLLLSYNQLATVVTIETHHQAINTLLKVQYYHFLVMIVPDEGNIDCFGRCSTSALDIQVMHIKPSCIDTLAFDPKRNGHAKQCAHMHAQKISQFAVSVGNCGITEVNNFSYR